MLRYIIIHFSKKKGILVVLRLIDIKRLYDEHLLFFNKHKLFASIFYKGIKQ